MNVRITVCRAAGLAAVVTAISGLGLSAGASAATTPSAAAAVVAQPATAVPPPTGGPVTCAIQSNNGDFLTAVGGGGRTTDPVIRTNATQIGSWERFTLVPAGDGIHYGIRTVNGHFLTAVGGGGRITDVIHSDATWLRAWEEFIFVPARRQRAVRHRDDERPLPDLGRGRRPHLDAIHSDAVRGPVVGAVLADLRDLSAGAANGIAPVSPAGSPARSCRCVGTASWRQLRVSDSVRARPTRTRARCSR